MNKKTIIKICIDAAMYALFLLLMGEFLLKEAHMWLGIAFGVLFLLHNALNWRWYKNLFRGRTVSRAVGAAVNFLLWIAVVCCEVSGILILPDVFVWYEGGVKLHLASSAWAFVLMSVHLGIHWNMFVGMSRKIPLPAAVKTVLKWIFRAAVLAVCAYGIYVFAERRFWEELFLLIDYQKEYDFSKTAFIYAVGSAALSAAFVSAAYYIKKIFLALRRKRRAEVN